MAFWRFALLLAVALACSDGAGPGAPEGTLRFNYQGAIAGSFDATGAYPPPGEDCSTCAYAIPTVQGDHLGLSGHRARGDLRDMLTVTIPYPTGPGRYDGEIPSDFAYGIPPAVPGYNSRLNPEYAFRLTVEVFVSEINGERIRGEFTAEGEDFGSLPQDAVRRIEIANGTFDLPLVRR